MRRTAEVVSLLLVLIYLSAFSLSKPHEEDLTDRISKTYGVERDSVDVARIDGRGFMQSSGWSGEVYEAEIQNRFPHVKEKFFLDSKGDIHTLSKDFNEYLEISGKRISDEGSAIDVAAQYVENGFADRFSLPRVLQSASDIPGNAAKKHGNEIQAPAATKTQQGYSVKLFSWSDVNGVLVEWNVNISSKIDAATWDIIDIGVGEYLAQPEGFLPVPGKTATITDEPRRFLGKVNVTVNSTYADIFNNSGTTTVEPVNITLTDFDANQNVTVTIVLFNYSVSSRAIGKTLNVTNTTTNSAGTAYLVYYPNPDSHTGVGDIIANQSNNFSKSSTLWVSTGNYFVVEKIAFNRTFDNFANFSVYYFSANFGWNQTKADLFASYVLEGAARAYETFIGRWNLTYPDTDNSSYITISDGANDDSIRFEKGANKNTYGSSAVCTCIFSGNNTNIGIQGNLQNYLSSLGYTYPSEQNMTFSVAAHEFFHNIQFGYERWRHSNTLVEGTARFSESAIEPTANFYAGTLFYANNVNGVNGYISTPDQALSSFSYSYAIYWGYIYGNDGGAPLIRRILQEANGYASSANNIPEIVSISLGNISGWHKNFNDSVFDFSAAVFARNFSWGKYDGSDQKSWGDKMKNVSLAAFSYTSLSPFRGSIYGSVNAWAADFINISVPTSNYAFTFLGGSSDYRLKLVYRDASNNITEQNINMGSPRTASFTISNGTVHNTIALMAFRVNSSGNGSYSLLGELPESGTPLVYTNITPMKIPDNNTRGNSSSFIVAENYTINKVRVYVGINHSYIGDLSVALVTPNNTRIALHSQSGSGADDIFTWYENQTAATTAGSLDNLQNYYSGGAWSLNATDLAGDDVGNITTWKLLLFVNITGNQTLSNNLTFPASGAAYAPRQNYSFQVFANHSTLGISGISHVIFQLGTTNYTKNSNPAVQNSSGTFWINMTDVAAGTHDLIWYANDTQNAWNSSASSYTIARNYSAQFINLTINGTNGDASFPYDSITNVTAWKTFSEGNLTLYKNNSFVGKDGISQPNETLMPGGGIYNYTLVFLETQNYSFVNMTRILTITKRPTNATLLLNGTLGNFVFNLSQIANFTAFVNITGKNTTLTSNMTGWLDTNSTNAIYNLTLLSVTGIFNMTAYFAGDQNYSSSFQTSFATVRDVNAPNILSNQTSPGSGAVYYPNQIYKFNLTVSDDAGISHVILQFNSANHTAFRFSGSASSGNWSANITDLAANATGYPVVWYANDTSNNWNKSDAWHYIVNKNASAYTAIKANATTIELPRPFHVNSSSPVDSRIETRLYGNITATALALLNASASTNTYTWSFGATGIFNISANSSANENYTANATLEYVILTSVDTTSPALVRGSVLPRNVSNNRNISILIISDDYSTTTSSANIYNTTNHSIATFNLSYAAYTSAGVSSLNRTTLFIPFNITNLPSGIFYVNVSLTDFFGNSANYSAGNFTATSGAAGVLYGNSSLSVGQSTAINLTSEMNITLNISSVSEYDYSDSIAIALYVVNPSTPNSNAVSINKYYDIDVGGRLNYTTDWAEIRIFYNVSDVGSGYSEGNLRIYKLHSNGSWMPFSGTNLGGVNTTAKYAWANTTSFSLFGAFVMPTCADGIVNQDETGVDCGGVCSACSSPTTTLGSSGGSGGGGGGATTTITTTTTTTTTTATTTTTGPTNAANITNASATTTTTTTILKKTEESGTGFISILIAAVVAIAALILAATAYVVTRHHEKIAGFVSELKERFFKTRYRFK